MKIIILFFFDKKLSLCIYFLRRN
uniref:Uncharacterized protein n=1 Tax=Rhizophora mucronata TaxID=61149 RepID=A0A2P2P6Y1_RHIMU